MIYFFPQGSSKPNLSYSNLPSIQLSVDADCKEFACNAGDLSSIPELGRSPGEGNGYPLQYSGLENSMDLIVPRVAKSQTQLSDFHFFTFIGYYKIQTKVSCVIRCCFPVAKSRPTLCHPMDCSMLGSSVLYYLPEFAQIHVH